MPRSPWALPLVGLLLLAAPARARAQEGPPPAPALPACTVVVILPNAPCAPPVVDQGPPPAAADPAPYPYPYPYPYYYPPAPPSPSDLPPPPTPRSKSTFSTKLWAGPEYQKLFDVSMYSAAFGISLGAQRGISGWYAEMQGNLGETVHGLSIYEYWLGASWEGKIDRLHLGLGLHFGVLGISRATTGGIMSGGGAGGFGFASYDLYQSEDGHAVYVGARMTVDTLSDALLWGPSASLGWRY